MIKKLAIILLLVGLFCYFIAAVTVLNKPKEGLVCNGVVVVVEDSLQTGFIQSGEVLRLLESRKCNPTGQKMDQVMLSLLRPERAIDSCRTVTRSSLVSASSSGFCLLNC